MRAGPLRHTIEIQTKTETSDGIGGYTETWSTHTTARASISPLKGVELLEHKKLEHERPARIWMRYQSGVTAKMRISWNDRTFEIIDIRNVDERNRMIEILANELVM